MRSKKTILDVSMSLLLQLVTVICGFILPKLILQRFGSQYNGLTTSISQFLACAVLLRSGIGGVTRAALYKPLAKKDNDEISGIMNATNIFMRKIAFILVILIIIFSIIYPFFVIDEFSWIFSFSLFLIIGIGTVAESLLGITYLILLQADQKLWVASLFRIVSIVLNVVLASLLILNGFSIHIVKLGSSLAFCVYPLLLNIYVKRKYKLNKNIAPNNKAIGQRWDAFWHQVAIFVTNNTDVVVLTMFTNMLEVSVYSVYNMVISALKNLVFSFSSGLEAAFGNMIAKNQSDLLKRNLSLVEYVVFSIATLVYTCSIILIVSFVRIYTKGITDINYLRPTFACILLIAHFFYCIRIPYQMVIEAAGHYKQTRNGAIIEAFLNIFISVALVIKYGLVGVAIGTFISMAFRTIQLALYTSNKIIDRNINVVIKNLFISVVEAILIILITNTLNLNIPNTYFEWIINGVIVSMIAIFIIGIVTIIFYRDEFKYLIEKIKSVLKRKNKKDYVMENNI